MFQDRLIDEKETQGKSRRFPIIRTVTSSHLHDCIKLVLELGIMSDFKSLTIRVHDLDCKLRKKIPKRYVRLRMILRMTFGNGGT